MRETVRTNKAECTGCGACVSICPVQAISMQPDDEGFCYPVVDGSVCISCDQCEKRCPVGKAQASQRILTLGAQHTDEQIRRKSSSGGVFTALATRMLADGGVVFGAAFDEMLRLTHVCARAEADLEAMRGSKYLQSDASGAIAQASTLLDEGKSVLFSGTPCQIDGLLAKVRGSKREKLLTIDFVCHGVPSPGVFRAYLDELERKSGQKVVTYAFRDKRLGWKDFSAVATMEDGSQIAGTQRDEPFLYGFLQNLYLRPSCVQCGALRGEGRVSDITIADLWGAQDICPEKDDDTGLSLVFVNTEKGQLAVEAIAEDLRVFPVDAKKLLRYNPSIEKPASPHKKREAFFKMYRRRGFDSRRVMKMLAGPSAAERIIRRIAHLPIGALRRIRRLLKR